MNSFITLLLLSSNLYANTALKKALDKIPSSKDCKISITKKMESVVLQTTTTTPATLHVTKGKFHFETHTDNKNIIIHDSSWYWIIEYEADKINQVSRTKNKHANFNEILDSKLLKNNFTIKETITLPDVLVELTPKKENFAFEKANIIIKNNSLYQIQYKDDIENTTTLLIDNISCSSKINKQRYQYIPSKDQPILDL